MPILPGYAIWENTVPVTTAASPVVTPFIDTTGFTTLLLCCVIANSTGTTTFTVEGSFDGVTLDSTMTYTPAVTASTPAGGTAIVVQHRWVRFRIVQATANATTSTFFIQSRA